MRSQWRFADVKQRYSTVGAVDNNRVVFNVKGNKYRLIVKIDYAFGIVFVRFVGTHKQYDQVNAEEV